MCVNIFSHRLAKMDCSLILDACPSWDDISEVDHIVEMSNSRTMKASDLSKRIKAVHNVDLHQEIEEKSMDPESQFQLTFYLDDDRHVHEFDWVAENKSCLEVWRIFFFFFFFFL